MREMVQNEEACRMVPGPGFRSRFELRSRESVLECAVRAGSRLESRKNRYNTASTVNSRGNMTPQERNKGCFAVQVDINYLEWVPAVWRDFTFRFTGSG